MFLLKSEVINCPSWSTYYPCLLTEVSFSCFKPRPSFNVLLKLEDGNWVLAYLSRYENYELIKYGILVIHARLSGVTVPV